MRSPRDGDGASNGAIAAVVVAAANQRSAMRRVVLWGGRAGDVQFGSLVDRRQEAIRRQRAVRLRVTMTWMKAMNEIQATYLEIARTCARAFQRAGLT